MDWLKSLVGDTPQRLERYFNFTAIMQGTITGLLVLFIVSQLFKRK